MFKKRKDHVRLSLKILMLSMYSDKHITYVLETYIFLKVD